MLLRTTLSALLFLATSAAASPAKVTYYLDGAYVESEAATVKGELDIPLPRGMAAGSLRLKPLPGGVITRVEIVAARPDRNLEKEAARLVERKEALGDRLKTLDIKEEIYRSAARSQSGKAPRATKTNREPLESIRKGTDFALAQLEEVFKARRKAENELKTVESRLSALLNTGSAIGSVARVRLAGQGGRVAYSYFQTGLQWTPVYDFRLLANGELEIALLALLPESDKGRAVAVVPARLADAAPGSPVEVSAPGPSQIAVFRFPLESEQYRLLPGAPLAFEFTNRSERTLPPGEATCYRQGEYIGKVRFEGSPPGASRKLEFGRTAAPLP